MPYADSDYERSWKMQTKGGTLYPATMQGLIEAAPELLATLKRLLQCYGEYPSGQYHGNEVIADCKLVIAKAEGRSE